MIMASKKKNDIGAIIASTLPKKVEVEVEAPEQSMSGHEVAAEEILAAVEAKDPKALAEAMKSLVDMCMNEDSEEESESESEEY